MSDIYIRSVIFKIDTDTERDTETDMEKETDMETEIDMKRKWTWKRKRKLYLIQRNSPDSAARIVANIAVAE
jgi:hypothetical protein